MTSRTSRELLIAAGGLFAAFMFLSLFVKHSGPIPGDGRALAYARTRALPPQWLSDFEQFWSTAGTPVIGLLTTATATVIAWRTQGLRIALLVPAAAVIVFAEQPIADWVGTSAAACRLPQADVQSRAAALVRYLHSERSRNRTVEG